MLQESVANGTVTLLSLNMGPSVQDFVETCFKAAPIRFSFIWVSGFVACCISLSVGAKHRAELEKRPPSMQRELYIRVSWFATVLGVTSFVSLLCPRADLMMKMLQMLAEAFALYSFGEILFVLCAQEAIHKAASLDREEDSIGVKMLAALNEQGPQAFFGVPPFACCFSRCLPKHLLSPSQLILARTFVRQYVYIVVISGLLKMYFGLCLPTGTAARVVALLTTVTKVASLLCIYGLFFLYKATHTLLEKWNPTLKFASLKVMIVVMVYQEWVVDKLVEHFPPAGEECLGNLGLRHEHPKMAEYFQNQNRVRFNNMYLVALESIMVAYLVRRAFQAHEVQKMRAGDMHSMLLALDLKRVNSGRNHDHEASDSDDGTSESEVEMETKTEQDCVV